MKNRAKKPAFSDRGLVVKKEQPQTCIALPVIRFFLAHGVNLRAVESPFLRHLVHAIRADAADLAAANVPVDKSLALPSYEDLDACLKTVSNDQLLKGHCSEKRPYSSSTQLIIFFPHTLRSKRHQLLPSYDNSTAFDYHSSASFVASVFRLSSGSDLKYIGARNCQPDVPTSLTEIIAESLDEGEPRYDQIVIGRPLTNVEKARAVPRNDQLHVWIPDVAREVDILCQDLLAQVPLLVRCRRRNKLLATFFQEDYSERTATTLFGRDLVEKEQCKRYLAHIANAPEYPQCSHIIENAQQTCEILLQTQNSHCNLRRREETGNFLHSLTEDNSGNVQLCKQVVQLLLSTAYRKDLTAFISIMSPLSRLISIYNQNELSPERDTPPSSGPDPDELFSEPLQLRSRSLAYVLTDCVKTLRELYAEKMPAYENDLLLLRSITASRLLGKGTDGFPPIADDVCYVAAFLNPAADLATTKGISVEEAWRRAVQFLHNQYSNNSDVLLERVLEQLQHFHRRSGVFSVQDVFNDLDEIQDPRFWWAKHGSLAPDLCGVAMRVLSAPTTAFHVIQHIAEVNARDEDLHGLEKDELMDKRRSVVWNLKLAMYNTTGNDNGQM